MKHFATKCQQLKAISAYRLLIFSGLCSLLLAMAYSPLATKIEQVTSLRLLYALRGPIPPPDDIAIIALNSGVASRLELSSYSGNWPRTLHAELINKLQAADARLIVMDIAFKDRHNEEEDLALEQALSASNNVILFKYLKRHQVSTANGQLDIEQELPPLPRFGQHALASASFTLPKYPAQVYSTHLTSLLSEGPEATQPLIAYLALQSLEDQQHIWQTLQDPPALAINLMQRARQLIAHAHQLKSSRLTPSQKNILRVLQHTSALTINFYGYPKTITTWPLDYVLDLEPEAFRQKFQDKTVYIGFSDTVQTEQQDAYRTVFSDALGVDLSGVEISATVFSNLLGNHFIRSPTPATLLIITLLSLASGLLCYTCPPRWTLYLQLISVSLYLFLSLYLFNNHNLWLPIGLPAIALILANGLGLSRRFYINKKRIEHIQFTLSQFLPKDAATKFSQNVTALEQDRQLVHGVCLMTDIQGYTSLSEILEPDDLHQLMNIYYSELVSTVEEFGGFIGNLVGDGMLALWTGPRITPEMCQAALHASQEIQRRINNHPKLCHALPTCSAIHGGQFSLGNLGGQGHFEYSPVGDIINTASRVEHFNRNLGTAFLCTESIAKQLSLVESSEAIQLRPLGNFTFRNKALAMPLYGLAGNLGEQELSFFTKAVEKYEAGVLEEAEEIFERLSHDFEDEPSKYYLARLKEVRVPTE